MNNMDLYNKFRSVPSEAKRAIAGGRLKGMTDINPMWRIKALTEAFGPCGIGWWYKITDKRMEAYKDEIMAFVDIELYYSIDGKTSQPVVGTGGASFVAMEGKGEDRHPYVSDECFKMALTDAISVAAKALGVGADVYYEKDRDKYTSATNEPQNAEKEAKTEPPKAPASGPVCRACGKSITNAERDYSMGKYGRELCRSCQKKA